MANFNNPSNLNLSNSFSTVSVTLDNPAVTPNIDYGDFRSADPNLAMLLPKNLNYGITSPGTINMETDCNGLDYVDVNLPDYNKLPFEVCLNKFSDQYKIPQLAFNNLMNNLPYTFSALSQQEKEKYLKSLQKFINENKNETNFNNKKVNFQEKEHLENMEKMEITNKKCSGASSKTIKILYISIIVIICLLFMFYMFDYFNKKKII